MTRILFILFLLSGWMLLSSFLPTPVRFANGVNGLAGDIPLSQIGGIVSLVAGMIVYQLSKMRDSDFLNHLGKALILASVLLNFMPILQSETSQKSMMIAILFGMTGIILSAIIFFQFRNGDEDDDEHADY